MPGDFNDKEFFILDPKGRGRNEAAWAFWTVEKEDNNTYM